jgi:hypothetical protein
LDYGGYIKLFDPRLLIMSVVYVYIVKQKILVISFSPENLYSYKMKRIHWSFAIVTLAFGFFLGTSTLGTATAADPTPNVSAPQGDLLKVCIDKRTGAIRASVTCKSTEKSYVLGGPGAQGVQGDKGEVGAIGPQGVQGSPGIAGTNGKSADLKIKTISFLASSTCAGVLDGYEIPVVNRIDEYITTRTYARSWNGTLRGCSVSVYAP